MRRARRYCKVGRLQQPYSANDSKAFQSSGRSRAMRDWVMVCSSTLRARPVAHSTKRQRPGRVKPTATESRMACQSDHSRVAFILHLLMRTQLADPATARVYPGGVLVKQPQREGTTASFASRDCRFTRNYCPKRRMKDESRQKPAFVFSIV